MLTLKVEWNDFFLSFHFMSEVRVGAHTNELAQFLQMDENLQGN